MAGGPRERDIRTDRTIVPAGGRDSPVDEFAAPARRLPRNPLIFHPTADCPLPTVDFFSPLRRAQA
jgi:hypothetical protein